MTTSELRELAGSIVAYTGESPPDDPYDPIVAALALAEQWLAEHPCDDDERFDEAFLLSRGWQWREEWQSYVNSGDDVCVQLSRSSSAPDVWALQYEDAFHWPHGIHNRGCLRKVLAVLGIELKQAPA